MSACPHSAIGKLSKSRPSADGTLVLTSMDGAAKGPIGDDSRVSKFLRRAEQTEGCKSAAVRKRILTSLSLQPFFKKTDIQEKEKCAKQNIHRCWQENSTYELEKGERQDDDTQPFPAFFHKRCQSFVLKQIFPPPFSNFTSHRAE